MAKSFREMSIQREFYRRLEWERERDREERQNDKEIELYTYLQSVVGRERR
jgi:hypothetical protein